MDGAKRRPGRPKGSEIDDSAPLMAMARLVTDHPGLPPKTAARRVFKASGREAHREAASIHRWHGKWRTAGASYLQRVQDERAAAEAERQRRERAAAEARERSRKSWPELVAELRAAGQLPDWKIDSTAWDAFAQHRDAMRNVLPAMGSLANYRPPAVAMRSTAFDMFAEARRPGSALYEAMRAHRGMLDNPILGEAMRKAGALGMAIRQHGEVGRALSESFSLVPKLPKGL